MSEDKQVISVEDVIHAHQCCLLYSDGPEVEKMAIMALMAFKCDGVEEIKRRLYLMALAMAEPERFKNEFLDPLKFYRII